MMFNDIMNNKFVFITPAYNCEDSIHKTIYSMMSQSYDNWRAIIINDISTDSTLERIKHVCNNSIYADRFTIIDNKEKHGEVRNTLKCMDIVDNDEIVCRVDGGDWLTENDCLYILNTVYNEYDPDVAWTSHRWAYTRRNISGPLQLNENMTVYNHPWVSSHMKTFRSKALKGINDLNFRDEDGEYIVIGCDQAIFLPMMHRSHLNKRNLIHIPFVCYHYSIDLKRPDLFTCERSIKQKNSAEYIRKRGYIE